MYNNQTFLDFSNNNLNIGNNVKGSIYNILRKKGKFEKIKVHNFSYKKYIVSEIELNNGFVRKIYLKDKNGIKFCINIKNYDVNNYNLYDEKIKIISNLNIPSFCKKTGTDRGSETYGKLINISSSNLEYKQIVNYVLKYFHNDVTSNLFEKV